MGKRPTDWRKRFGGAKPPHVVMLHTDFAGVRAGNTMLISSPGDIANYLSRIPRGETRTIERLRNELARKAGAQAMCPVTTAIYLRVVAEVALRDLEEGKPIDQVTPFWRVVTPDSKVAKKLSCSPDHVSHLIALDNAPAASS
ncbi:MAG: hypothetical protein ACK5WW_08775 [Brevundimonas sp.]|jgi:hypothetical protein|uniref:hypothetical protein n=1 Tax=Brevundimonas sp. TaxID=1871086 RepID=UPI0022C8125D|nr:hypothetical protein [Brevundimonas sp.]